MDLRVGQSIGFCWACKSAYGIGPPDDLACIRRHFICVLYSRSSLVTGNLVVQLGKISYGLYMLHYIGLLLTLSLLHPSWGWELLAAKAIGFFVTLVLALPPTAG